MTVPPTRRPRGLSKSKLLQARQCAKRLWLQVHQPELAVDDSAQRQRLAEGTRFGDLARELMGGGILIEHQDDLATAVESTRAAVAGAREGDRFFEAAFSHDGVLVRADALEHTRSGWVLTEVKSSTEVKGYHVEDAAVQAWVLRQSGLTLSALQIGFVDNAFVYRKPGDYRGLLRIEAVDTAVRPLLEQVDEWVVEARATLAGSMPEIKTGEHCEQPFACPFIDFCQSQEPPDSDFPVGTLYRGKKIAAALRAEGLHDLHEVPVERLKNPIHRRAVTAIRAGRAIIEDELPRLLAAIPYPRHYLDFETIGFAVPRWLGTRPYQQVPFQFSCHVETAPGQVEHREFLDLSGNSPIEPFADALIAACGEAGPIVVYNQSFEAGRIKELAEMLPHRAAALLRLLDRLFDLLPPIRNHYYHPDLHGSFSIKAVLPTVVPELRYDALDGVHDGGDAQAAFVEAIAPSTSSDLRSQIEGQLRRYCSLDTLAMLRLLQELAGDRSQTTSG
jgi:hypothetical protein